MLTTALLFALSWQITNWTALSDWKSTTVEMEESSSESDVEVDDNFEWEWMLVGSPINYDLPLHSFIPTVETNFKSISKSKIISPPPELM